MTGALALFPRFILTAVRLVSVLFADAGTGGAAGAQTDSETEAERIERETVEIMDQLGNAILRLAYSYLHNMEDAEDILQETLIKFVTTKPVFENEKHRKAWLLTVAANLAKNRIEYNRVRSSEELNEEIAGAAPEEEEDDLSYVWEAVKKLPDNQREVIHLFYQEGYKTAEIADILGRKEATIRSDLKRARDKLKEILKEANDFE
ncbi:MAG: sigma-70 family RNA polymerase sigma factor [Clostridiales bacterium]|nr:sigma-70 family RNA polymerase sigma factor [Clostridiales bacterium]MBR5358213.1 sigma-70 family RNA polymerase sigma factor [Clostridiales bacterium]